MEGLEGAGYKLDADVGVEKAPEEQAVPSCTIPEQAEHIREWLGQAEGEQLVDVDIPERSTEAVGLTDVPVLTPNLGSTQETFAFLWEKIAKTFPGKTVVMPFGEEAPIEEWDARYTIQGIDEELPEGQRRFSDQFHHFGEATLLRPSSRVTVSRIDLTAGYNPASLEGTHITEQNKPIHPAWYRTPETAPHVEVLAYLAHNPAYIRNMLGAPEGSLPWLWVPGCQFHDVRGTVAPKTPIIAVVNGELHLTGVWNDSGNAHAASPRFVATPRAL